MLFELSIPQDVMVPPVNFTYTVAHFSTASINRLLTYLLTHKERKIQTFVDVFFEKRLTKIPKNECWLKVREHLDNVSRRLSFKQPQNHTSSTDPNIISFKLATDRAEIEQLVLSVMPDAQIQSFAPFLSILIKRVSLCVGGVELWVDSACLCDSREGTLSSMLAAPVQPILPSRGGGWFVSGGCRMIGSLPSVDAILDHFQLPRDLVSELMWVPSKAYYFCDLLSRRNAHNWCAPLHFHKVDPLAIDSLVLSGASPSVEGWLDAWAGAFTETDADKSAVKRQLAEALLALLDLSSTKSLHTLAPPEVVDQLASMSARMFDKSDGEMAALQGTLYQMLHLWEATFPFSQTELEATVNILLSVDEAVWDDNIDRFNSVQVCQLMRKKRIQNRPVLYNKLLCQRSCFDDLSVRFNTFQMNFKIPAFLCSSATDI